MFEVPIEWKKQQNSEQLNCVQFKLSNANPP